MPDIRDHLRQHLARLVALGYPNAPTSKEMREAWVAVMADDLGDVPPMDLDAAFTAYRRSADPQDRFMPTPGRIRSLTPAAVMLAEAKSRAGDAWQATYRALADSRRGAERIREPATWGGALPPEPVLVAVEEAVAGCGGWRALGATSDPGRFVAPRFRQHYEAALTQRAAPHRTLPPVAARAELTDGR